MEISIIQGDSAEYYLSLEDMNKTRNDTPVIVDRIVFTCHDLGIEKDFVYDKFLNKYLLAFTKDETINYRSLRSDYDITFYFRGNTVKTVVLNGTLKVLEKKNKVGGVS